MQKQPVFNLPASIFAIVALLVAIHGYREYVSSQASDGWILVHFGFTPGRLSFHFDPQGVANALNELIGAQAADRLAAARYFLGDGALYWWTPLTYAFLHVNWAHCGVNCLWLVAFGAPVARRFGTARFLALFALTAVAGALAHWAAYPFDFTPVIGASAAVSGATSAAARFVFEPGAPLGGVAPLEGEGAFGLPAPRLWRVLMNRRALIFIVLWFGLNVLFGMISAPLGITDGPVAWVAHLGGFLAGLLLFPLFDPAPREARSASGSDDAKGDVDR